MCKETGPSPSHCSLGAGWDAAGGWLGGKSILVFFFSVFLEAFAVPHPSVQELEETKINNVERNERLFLTTE